MFNNFRTNNTSFPPVHLGPDEKTYKENYFYDYHDEEDLVDFDFDSSNKDNENIHNKKFNQTQLSLEFEEIKSPPKPSSTSTTTINFIPTSNQGIYTNISQSSNQHQPDNFLQTPSNTISFSNAQKKKSYISNKWSNSRSYLKNINNWNKLNLSLFFAYTFSTAATTVPISIVPAIFESFSSSNDINDLADQDQPTSQTTVSSSRIASFAVLGCALGKFLNGHLSDVFGARHVAIIYSCFMALSLFGLSFAQNPVSVSWACALVEFFQSVQWPCCVNILAAHYHYEGEEDTGDPNIENTLNDDANNANLKNKAKYTGGVYVTSLASRFGALIAMPFCSLMLQNSNYSWRSVARLGAMSACINSLIYKYFIMDSPLHLNLPINPLKSWNSNGMENSLRDIFFPKNMAYLKHSLITISRVLKSMFCETLYPSMKHVLSNGTFWIVSIAHTGGSMIRSSERILATYYQDTSHFFLSDDDNPADVNVEDVYSIADNQTTSGLVVFLSFGLLFGVIILGKIFTNAPDDEYRRKLVMTQYIGTVFMCYTLSILSIPWVQKLIQSSAIIRILQVCATFCMGVCIAVPYYHITPIVAAQFGKEKGMYSSYTEGVSFLVSSMVWKGVGGAVERGNPMGNGWAYGWAFIALLVIVSGVIMVEFMDHYFCRRGAWNRRISADTMTSADSHSYVKGEKRSLLNANTLLRKRNIRNINGMKNAIFNLPVDLNLAKHSKLFNSKKKSHLDDLSEHDMDSLSPTDEVAFFEEKSSKVTESSDGLAPSTLQERLQIQLEKEENQICADCPNLLPRWASILVPLQQDNQYAMNTSMGCFICQDCAGAHRNLGVHVCFVRSVDHDEWKENEVCAMEQGGNSRVNLYYEYLLANKNGVKDKPTFGSNGRDREKFAVKKYKKRLYYVESLNDLPNDMLLKSSFTDDSEHEDDDSLIELVHNFSSSHDSKTSIDQYESFPKYRDRADKKNQHFSDLKENGVSSFRESLQQNPSTESVIYKKGKISKFEPSHLRRLK